VKLWQGRGALTKLFQLVIPRLCANIRLFVVISDDGWSRRWLFAMRTRRCDDNWLVQRRAESRRIFIQFAGRTGRQTILETGWQQTSLCTSSRQRRHRRNIQSGTTVTQQYVLKTKSFFFSCVLHANGLRQKQVICFYLENLRSGLEGVVRNWRWVKSLARRRGSRTRRRSISVSVAAFSSKSEVSSCCRVTVKAAKKKKKKKKLFWKNLSVTHYGRTNVDWASPHAMPHHLIVSAVCRYTFSCAREKKVKIDPLLSFSLSFCCI